LLQLNSVYLYICTKWTHSIEEGINFLINFDSSLWNVKEKAPYEAKAAKRKAEYEKLIKAYEKKQVRNLCQLFCCVWHLWLSCVYILYFLWCCQASSADDDESDKSKSEVNDEDDASGEVVFFPHSMLIKLLRIYSLCFLEYWVNIMYNCCVWSCFSFKSLVLE